MRFEALRVVHLPKSAVINLPDFNIGQFDAKGFVPHSFLIASCQRWIWVCTPAELTADLNSGKARLNGLEIHAGPDAYDFLLRIACGLESQILGETDIFGQLKEAWFKSDTLSASLRVQLAPWMQKLFEDTKEIRSLHLQNLGGASYGTLVRKIIRDSHKGGPVLIIGAGQIARSIAPYLKDQELWLWNRSSENLEILKQELGPEAKIRIISTPEEKAEAWKTAGHVAVCVPIDLERETERARLWEDNESAGTVIHLGGYSDFCGDWNKSENFFALDDLFDLQKAQGDVRLVQVARARKACLERAKLRSLGGSITLAHGWEDLAAFG